jgi:fluoroquinolone transport system permease protein
MKSWMSIWKRDAVMMSRDPILAFSILGPALLLLALVFLLPLGLEAARPVMDLDFLQEPIGVFAIQMPSYILGAFLALLILEDRDDGTWSYYGVMPLGQSGLFWARILIGAVLSWLYSVVFFATLDFGLNFWEQLLWSLILTANVPLFCLFIAGAAPTKLEGIALLKLAGLFLLGPFLSLIDNPIVDSLAWVFPSSWANLSITSPGDFFSGVLGFCVSAGIWIGIFSWLFGKRGR